MLSTVCAVWLAWAGPVLGWYYYGQPSAALWNDQLFTATQAKLYRGTFAPESRRVREPSEYSIWSRCRAAPANLDLRNDRLLVANVGASEHQIYPLAEVPLLELTDFGDALRKARGYPDPLSFSNRYAGPTAYLLFPGHRDPDVPPVGKVDDFPEATYVWNRARYSLQIAGPKSVRLFHAHEGKLFVSVEPDYLYTWFKDDGTDGKPPNRELRTGKLPKDFTETFAVYTSAKRDYFVTDTGKLYAGVPKGKAEVEVTKVWDDPKRRIVGVVQDLASDAVYGWGFATTSAKPERFYVKFEPKPVAVAYKLTVPLWIDRSDAYLESYECARAFRKAAAKK